MDSWAAAAAAAAAAPGDDANRNGVAIPPFLVRRRKRPLVVVQKQQQQQRGQEEKPQQASKATAGVEAETEIDTLKRLLHESEDKCKKLRDLLVQSDNERKVLEKRLKALELELEGQQNGVGADGTYINDDDDDKSDDEDRSTEESSEEESTEEESESSDESEECESEESEEETNNVAVDDIDTTSEYEDEEESTTEEESTSYEEESDSEEEEEEEEEEDFKNEKEKEPRRNHSSSGGGGGGGGCPPLINYNPKLHDVKITSRQFIKQRTGRFSEHYSVEGLIKRGSFGLVASCRHIMSQQVRCVKEMKKSKKNAEANQKVLHEFEVLRELDHPNILKMYELFEDKKHYYIVTELCQGGDLLDALRERTAAASSTADSPSNNSGPFNEHDAALMMMPVLSCLNYCHSKRLVHRDLKLGNIVLEANKPLDQIKVIDFGEATCFENDVPLTEFAGTLAFMAPEVCNTLYGPKCDVWSCGIIAYIMLTGVSPFKGQDDKETFKNILQKDLTFDEPVWGTLSSRARDFVAKLLRRGETNRPSAAEALQHPWIQAVQRKRSCLALGSRSAHQVLDNVNMSAHNPSNKLQQATSTFIASQLLLKHKIEEIDVVFRSMDTDADGRLTRDEIRDGYMKVYGKKLSEAEIDEMFANIDLDGGGYIEYSEFVVASTSEQDLLSRENLRQAFDAFDKDGSGGISPDELMNLFQSSMGHLDESIARNLVESIDKDGDGEVSFEEFAEMVLQVA